METATFRIILKLMFDAQDILNMSGIQKKEYVMNGLKDYLENETYERYSPIISLFIDSIKEMSKNKSLLNGLKKTKIWCC